MKKFISIILSTAILFSISATAYATEADTAYITSAVVDISGGNLYTSEENDKRVAILTNDENHLLDVSICYLSAPNTVYQWTITDYPISTFTPSNPQFWYNIVDYVEDQMSDANIVYFTEVTYEEPIELPQTRSSAGSDLLDELEELMGLGEYSDTVVHSITYQGQRYRILEYMDFRILTDGSKSWANAIQVSSLIVTVLGLVASSTLITAICCAFGVVASASSLLPAGTINKYLCVADVCRWVSINGSAYPYNITDKYFEYKGYENASNDSREKAYIDDGSLSEYFTDDEAYFNSNNSQIMDAYVVFSRIGQMD